MGMSNMSLVYTSVAYICNRGKGEHTESLEDIKMIEKCECRNFNSESPHL